jgi:hypothetical protein
MNYRHQSYIFSHDPLWKKKEFVEMEVQISYSYQDNWKPQPLRILMNLEKEYMPRKNYLFFENLLEVLSICVLIANSYLSVFRNPGGPWTDE